MTLPLDLEARNCGCLGNALLAKGDLEGAERLYERAAKICGEVGEKRYLGIWVGNLGNVSEKRGDSESAIARYEKAIALAREAKDRRHESWWLGILGNLFFRQGDIAKGRRSLDSALAISERIGFRRGMLFQTDVLATFDLLENDPGRMAELLRRIVRESDKNENPFAVWKYRFLLGIHVLKMAIDAMEKGHMDVAAGLCLEVLECLPDFQPGYKFLGSVYRKTGKLRQDREILLKGVECLTRAVKICPDAGAYEDRAACHYYLNDLENALQDYEQVVRLAPKATGAFISKMETEIALGRFPQARETFEGLDTERVSPSELAIALCWMAISLALDGLPNSEYLSHLENMDIIMKQDIYDPTDIEPHLKRLHDSGIPGDRSAEATKAYQLLLSKYQRPF